MLSVNPYPNTRAATLGEVVIGLAIFAMLTLAVVGTLIQTAQLETKDTSMTEVAMLADALLEQRVSEARDYRAFMELEATPSGEYWNLEEDRTDGLQHRYLYRVEVEEPTRGLKRVNLSIFYRDSDFPGNVVDSSQGQAGQAIALGTILAEPPPR